MSDYFTKREPQNPNLDNSLIEMEERLKQASPVKNDYRVRLNNLR